MKISKLFHWLYAIVLLLPVFSIGGKMLYVTINKNAYMSYSDTTSYNITPINSNNASGLFLTGRNYIFNGFNYNYEGIGNNNVGQFTWTECSFDFQEYFNMSFEPSGIRFNNTWAGGFYACDFYNPLTATWTEYGYSSPYRFDETTGSKLNFEFVLESYKTTPEYNDSEYIIYNFASINLYTNLLGKLDNVFYYAVNQINEQPLFAWAQDSFLVEPIAYVSELFGLSNTSPLITLLSYWLNMSIIWLCFDIIMYVPLMAHRWLDKGAIE